MTLSRIIKTFFVLFVLNILFVPMKANFSTSYTTNSLIFKENIGYHFYFKRDFSELKSVEWKAARKVDIYLDWIKLTFQTFHIIVLFAFSIALFYINKSFSKKEKQIEND